MKLSNIISCRFYLTFITRYFISVKKVSFIFLLLISLKAVAQDSNFLFIDSLLQKGRYQLALKELEKIQPPTFLVNYKKGTIYSSIDNHKKAIGFYKKALGFKEDYVSKLMLGKSYQKLKKYDISIAIYEELLAEDSKNLVLTYQLGKLYLTQNKLDKAEETFKSLIEKDKKNVNYYYQLGLIYAKKGEGNSMINSFLKAYKRDSTHIKSVYQLAKVFTQLSKASVSMSGDSATVFINRGLRLDSLHINLNKLKINELFRNKKYKEAVGLLNKLDSLTPDKLYTKKMLGRSYFNLEEFDKAEKEFLSAKEIDKDDFKVFTYLGHIYKAKKKYMLAGINYFIATKIGKKSRHDEYYSLGILYLEMKVPKRAIEMFQKSIKENRKYYKALYQLALTADSYYKDKKIAYRYYEDYLNRFQRKDKDLTAFVNKRMKDIKKELFFKGDSLQ